MWNLVRCVNGIVVDVFICRSFEECLDHAVEKCFDIGEEGEEVGELLRKDKKVVIGENAIEMFLEDESCIPLRLSF